MFQVLNFLLYIVLILCTWSCSTAIAFGDIEQHDYVSKAKSKPKPDKVYKLLIVGLGMGGSYSSFRASKFSKNKDFAGEILVIEGTNRTCGNIVDLEFITSTNKRPLRAGRCAARINLGTMPHMRCLANELRIPIYYSPWNTEYRMNGWVAKSSLFNHGPNYPDDETPNGNHNNGTRDLIFPVGGGSGAWKLKTYSNTYGDPIDDAWGWFLGYPGYSNPSYEFNGATMGEYNADDPTQDHPRWQCGKFKSLYSLYLHYFGSTYANFICVTNFGFLGDCYVDNDACSYLAINYAAYNQADEGYPVGGMSEFCTKEQVIGKANGVSYHLNEPVTSINRAVTKDNSKYYIVATSLGTYKATDLILNIPPQSILKMTGDVIDELLTKPQLYQPKNLSALTITVQYDMSVEPWWSYKLNSISGSYRMLNPSSCLNRLEMQKTPISNATHGFRAVYSDFTCLAMWRHLISIGKDAVQAEVMRELNEEFGEELPTGFVIPTPILIEWKITETAWWYLQPGTPYTWQDMTDWAIDPLETGERVCLAHSSYMIYYSGWANSAINASDACLHRLYPNDVPTSLISNWTTCNGHFVDDNTVYEDYSIPALSDQYDYSKGLDNEFFPPYHSNDEITWEI